MLGSSVIFMGANRHLNVDKGSDACYALYFGLGLPKRRFTVAFECFLCCYHERLQQHSNVLGVC